MANYQGFRQQSTGTRSTTKSTYYPSVESKIKASNLHGDIARQRRNDIVSNYRPNEYKKYMANARAYYK